MKLDYPMNPARAAEYHSALLYIANFKCEEYSQDASMMAAAAMTALQGYWREPATQISGLNGGETA